MKINIYLNDKMYKLYQTIVDIQINYNVKCNFNTGITHYVKNKVSTTPASQTNTEIQYVKIILNNGNYFTLIYELDNYKDEEQLIKNLENFFINDYPTLHDENKRLFTVMLSQHEFYSSEEMKQFLDTFMLTFS